MRLRTLTIVFATIALVSLVARADWTTSEPGYVTNTPCAATSEATWNSLESSAEPGDMSVDLDAEMETPDMYALRFDTSSTYAIVMLDCEIDAGLTDPMLICGMEVYMNVRAWSTWNVSKTGSEFYALANGRFKFLPTVPGVPDYPIEETPEALVEHFGEPAEDDHPQDAMEDVGGYSGGIAVVPAHTANLYFELSAAVTLRTTRADMTIGGRTWGGLGVTVTAWAENPPEIQFIEETTLTEVQLGG